MKTHSETVGLDCLKAAKKQWGNAWMKLSPEMRHGALCAELVHMLLCQREDGGQSALEHAQAVARAAIQALDASA